MHRALSKRSGKIHGPCPDNEGGATEPPAAVWVVGGKLARALAGRYAVTGRP